MLYMKSVLRVLGKASNCYFERTRESIETHLIRAGKIGGKREKKEKLFVQVEAPIYL